MPTTRREFIKRSAGAVSISMLLPELLFAAPQNRVAPDPDRRILVLLELSGGNDGLSVMIPYSDDNYHKQRPILGFRGEELKDTQGNSTIINNEFGFHPSMKELKKFYDEGKLAPVLGVGYENQSLSHFASMHVWQSGRLNNSSLGWIGRYADLNLQGKSPLSAVAIGGTQPLTVLANRVNIPRVKGAGETLFINTPGDLLNSLNFFRKGNNRDFPESSFIKKIAEVGTAAERSGELLQSLLASYTSTQFYPLENPIADALKFVAALTSVSAESNIFHIGYPGFFDTHAFQIGTPADGFKNKLIGNHPRELKRISEAIKVFYDDMVEQGLADNLLLMTYSEFGRRPNENASTGTDHGTASNLFVFGNKVKGGDLYGLQPSLSPVNLTTDGNMRFTTDFRSVYATILDKWLVNGDTEKILGNRFAPLGFL
jgi:uncharacterized protein (DUF1501 family)